MRWSTSLEGGEVFDEGVDGFEIFVDGNIVDSDKIFSLQFFESYGCHNFIYNKS